MNCSINNKYEQKIETYINMLENPQLKDSGIREQLKRMLNLLKLGKISKVEELEVKLGWKEYNRTLKNGDKTSLLALMELQGDTYNAKRVIKMNAVELEAYKQARQKEKSKVEAEQEINELFAMAEVVYGVNDDSMNIRNIFNTLKNRGRKLTKEHEQKLEKELDKIEKQLDKLAEVKIGISEDGQVTKGAYHVGTKEIGIVVRKKSVKTGLDENPAELLIHELYHALTEAGLRAKEGYKLFSQITELMNDLENKITPEMLMDDRFKGTEKQKLNAAKELHEYIFSSPSEFIAHTKSNAKLMELIENEEISKRTHTREEKIKRTELGMLLPLDTIYEKIGESVGKLTDMVTGNLPREKQRKVEAELDKLIQELAKIGKESTKEIKKDLYNSVITDPLNKLSKFAKKKLEDQYAIETLEEFEQVNKQVRKEIDRIKNSNDGLLKKVKLYAAQYARLKRMQKFDREKMNGKLKVQADMINEAMKELHGLLKQIENRLQLDNYINKGIFDERGLILNIINSITGGKEALKKYEMLGLKKTNKIDNTRNKEIYTYKKMYEELTYDKITDEERVAITNVMLKTEIGAISQVGTVEELLSKLDKKQRTDRIDELNKQIRELVSTREANYMIYQAEALGNKMIKRTVQNGQVSKVEDIVELNMLGTLKVKKLKQKDKKVVYQLVNELKSLHALDRVDAEEIHTVEQLIRHDQLEVNGLIKHLKKFREDLDKEGREAGYLVEKFNNSVATKVGKLDDSTKEEMSKKGYKLYKELEMEHLSIEGKGLGVYVLENGLQMEKVQGIASITGSNLQNTRLTSILKSEEGLTKSDKVKIEILELKEQMKQEAEIKKQLQGTAKIVDDESILLPVMTQSGLHYAVQLTSKDIKEIYDNDENYSDVLARSKARKGDIQRTLEINEELADMLFEDYVSEYVPLLINPKRTKAQNREMYQKYVALDTSEDPEIQEIWNLLPAETKAYIRKKYQDNEIMVHKDVLVAAFGYRKKTIANVQIPAILGGGDLFSTKESKKIVRQAEEIWQNIIALEKVQIVLKTPEVFYTNVISNSVYIVGQYGVPVKYMFSKTKEAIVNMESYQRDEAEYIEEAAKKEAGLEYSDTKLQRLELALVRNPVQAMVKAGMFQTIVEDIDTTSFKSNNKLIAAITERSEQLMGKKVTGYAQAVLVAENTKLFGLLMKATQYSDFTARYVVHMWNMEQGMNEQESLSKIATMFINYNNPDSATLQYLNDSGFFMFTKFFLRIQPVIASTLKEKPAQGLMTIMAQYMLWDVEDINDSSFADTELEYKIHMNPFTHIIKAFTPAPLLLL